MEQNESPEIHIPVHLDACFVAEVVVVVNGPRGTQNEEWHLKLKKKKPTTFKRNMFPNLYVPYNITTKHIKENRELKYKKILIKISIGYSSGHLSELDVLR